MSHTGIYCWPYRKGCALPGQERSEANLAKEKKSDSNLHLPRPHHFIHKQRQYVTANQGTQSQPGKSESAKP